MYKNDLFINFHLISNIWYLNKIKLVFLQTNVYNTIVVIYLNKKIYMSEIIAEKIQKDNKILRKENTVLRKENKKLHKQTKQKNIELFQLRSENNLYFENTKLFHNWPVVVFKWANAPLWPVEYVSPNVKEILWYTREDFRKNKKLYAQMIHPDDLNFIVKEGKEYIKKKSEYFTHKPYRLIAKSGKEVLIYDYTTICRDNDWEITHMVGCIIDISFNKDQCKV